MWLVLLVALAAAPCGVRGGWLEDVGGLVPAPKSLLHDNSTGGGGGGNEGDPFANRTFFEVRRWRPFVACRATQPAAAHAGLRVGSGVHRRLHLLGGRHRRRRCSVVGCRAGADFSPGQKGIFVPTFILVLGLNAHYALPLSQVTILGVSLGSLAFLLPQRHPTLPRRLVDLSLASLLEVRHASDGFSC